MSRDHRAITVASRPAWRRLAAAGSVEALAAVACAGPHDRPGSGDGAGGNDPAGRWRYPGADWQRVAPGDAGFDATGLRQLAEQAEAAGSSCLVVTRDGVVVDAPRSAPTPPATR